MAMIRLKVEEKVEVEYLVDIEISDDLTEEDIEKKVNELEQNKNFVETFGKKIENEQTLSTSNKFKVTEYEIK